jgi:hypothetical protein
MRLEINTSGSWRVLCDDVPAEQLEAVRDGCEMLVNLCPAKTVCFRLTRSFPGTARIAVDHIRKTDSPGRVTWESRR